MWNQGLLNDILTQAELICELVWDWHGIKQFLETILANNYDAILVSPAQWIDIDIMYTQYYVSFNKYR